LILLAETRVKYSNVKYVFLTAGQKTGFATWGSQRGKAASEEMEPRISRMARIRNNGFSIREIRAIRGKNLSEILELRERSRSSRFVYFAYFAVTPIFPLAEILRQARLKLG
jgi:hypothetical protein